MNPSALKDNDELCSFVRKLIVHFDPSGNRRWQAILYLDVFRYIKCIFLQKMEVFHGYII